MVAAVGEHGRHNQSLFFRHPRHLHLINYLQTWVTFEAVWTKVKVKRETAR